MTTAGIYARISDDREGEGLGVDRQKQDCLAKADAMAWTVEDVYVDNDISATSGKTRPEYDRLMADLASGRLDALVVYDLDRLTRRPIELEAFMDLAERRHISLANVSGDVDLTTSSGRMMARIKGAVARQEAERIGERVSRQKRQRAEQGLPQGSRDRVFGYTKDWQVFEIEAVIVREIFTRRAAGESMTAICHDLNARGITTVAGKPWKAGTMTTTLRKPGYVGKREYNRQIIGTTNYPALVDEATFEAAQTAMANASRGTNARTHLLSGICICSLCLSPMKGNSSSGRYRCASTYGGCGSLTIKTEWADNAVISVVLARHRERRAAPQTHDYAPEIQAVDDKIVSLQALATSGALDPEDFAVLASARRAERKALVRAASEQVSTSAGILGAYEDWKDMNLSQRRTLIAAYVERVVVHRRTTVGKKDNERERLEVHWTDGTKQRVAEADDTYDPRRGLVTLDMTSHDWNA